MVNMCLLRMDSGEQEHASSSRWAEVGPGAPAAHPDTLFQIQNSPLPVSFLLRALHSRLKNEFCCGHASPVIIAP